MDIDAKSSPQHWRLQDILLYLNNKNKRDTAEKILHSILTSGDILTWNPEKEMVYHGRNIPNTNIIDLLDYTFLPYEAHIPEPRGLELFIKGLAEIGINITSIENEYLLTKLAKEEHKMPESQSDDESDSSVVESDDSDDEKESVNESIQSDSDEEMESNSEKLTCHHCEKDHAHIVYLLTCPRCSWRDFYWDKDDHCTICDEASTLDFSHVIGFCDSCAGGVSYSKSGTTIFTPNKETYRE